MAQKSSSSQSPPLGGNAEYAESHSSRSVSSISRIHHRLRGFRVSSEPTIADNTTDLGFAPHLGLKLLHDSEEPSVDVIFIHGLGGSWMKTWCSSTDPSSFWPREWLPSEPGFGNARIHSYGYNAKWSQKEQSLLRIHDIGQAFLVDMFNCPHLRKNDDTSIVIVAHSLGGLVAKKAYLIATRDPIYQQFSTRMHSMYFLATPHRGAGSAQFLSRYLSVAINQRDKSYVDELFPGSNTLQTINDEFRHVAPALRLWSFFEGRATKIGVSSFIVVEKDSAVIGLPMEHTRHLEADHRNICKFDSPKDPNYGILLRCLMTTMDHVQKDYMSQRQNVQQSEMRLISKFFSTSEKPEADLLAASEKQLLGTCTWLTNDPTFIAWCERCHLDETSTTSRRQTQTARFLWLHGAPGSGKSVCCGHVVRFLETKNLNCSYYFLKYGNREKSSVDRVLKSLILQMAELIPQVRKSLLSMIEAEERIVLNDYSMLWSNVFLNRIFKIELTSPQYWVIDALDECGSKGSNVILQLFSKIPPEVPLQILLSSRPDTQVASFLAREAMDVKELQTGQAGSLEDIAQFIRLRNPRGRQSDFSEIMVGDIVTKSKGIFLWATLVINRLEESFCEEDMHEVLEQVPSEMNEYYNRIATKIAGAQNLELAKCVLKWTVCCPRPLTTNEMREAVKYDIGRTLTASDDRLGQLCGSLVKVDEKSEIHVIHQTVNTFVIQHQSEFRIDTSVAHARLAEICLTHLTNRIFMPQRSRRTSSNAVDFFLTDYADAYFAFHLCRCSLVIDAPLVLLGTFLRSHVLTWIERAARSGHLSTLLQTAQSMKTYLTRRRRYRSPLGEEVGLTEAWINDLGRIVAAFGSNLLDLPSSIYSIVPVVSPPASNIYRQFAKESRRLSLVGRAADEDWDDRISCFVYDDETTALAACEQAFAVGLSSGKIKVYSSATLELLSTLEHGESIRHLAFGNTSTTLLASGYRKLTLWSSKRTLVWTKEIRHPITPLSMCFGPDDENIFSATTAGPISILLASDGSEIDSFPLHHSVDSESSEDEERKIIPGTPPMHVRLSVVRGLAAVTYRTAPVLIWDMDRRRKVGVFYRPGTEGAYSQPQVFDMVFNPITEIDLLAISYDAVGIVTCDPWTLQQYSVYEIDARNMAASLDGRTLVASDYSGMINVFAFEASLKLQYRISTVEAIIRAVKFAPNNLRFYDIRGKFCSIWEPPVLVRHENLDHSSSDPQSDECIIAPETKMTKPLKAKEHITSLASSTDSYVFCGRENGIISVYNSITGERRQDFAFYENNYDIKHIVWSAESKLLICVNSVNKCVAHLLAIDQNGLWTTKKLVLSLNFGSPVTQILEKESGDIFLVATSTASEVWTTNGRRIAHASHNQTEERGRWMCHPKYSELLLSIHQDTVQVFEWATLKRLTMENGVSITAQDVQSIPAPSSFVSRKGYDYLMTAGSKANNQTNTTAFAIIDSRQLTADAKAISIQCSSLELREGVSQVLGIYKTSILFVDNKGWVCSALKGAKNTASYTRHFFIPHTWMAGTDLLIHLLPKSSIALAHREDLIIFHGFLDFEETISLIENSTI